MPSAFRHLELSPKQLAQYLRLLVVIAAPVCGKNPSEPPGQPLDVWGEWRRFREAFDRSRDPVQDHAAPYAVVRLFPPTLENLRHALAFGDASSAYQIVHFIGHGNTAGLALEDEFGREQFVPVAELTAAFKNSRAKLVVLNACETRPLAQALQHAGIPSVIGTHAPIADEAAKIFSETFYSRLALGQSLQTAFTAAQEILTNKFGEAAAQNLSLLQLTDTILPLPQPPATDFLLLANEPPHNLPLTQYTRHFAGRGPELVQIGEWMAELAEPVIALHGVGGIGKSSLATMAALRHSHRFDAVIFATAKDDPENFGVEKIVQALDAVCGTSCLGEATPEKRQQAALRVLNSRRLLLVLDNLETLSPAATTALGNFLRQLDHRLGSLALLTLRPRQKNPLTDLAGRYLLPVERLDLLSAVQLLVGQAGSLFYKIPLRPPTPAEKPQLSDFAGHLGFRPEALPQLASIKDLAEACHCHPRLMELALGDLRRPTTSFGAVIQRLQKLSGKDLQAAVDEMLGRMITALQAEAPEAVALLQIMTIFRGPAEVAALATVHAGEEPEAFDEALKAAENSSLLSAENDRVWLHSLTAQFLEKHAPLSEALAQTPLDTYPTGQAYRPERAVYRRRHAEYYLAKARQYKKDNMEQWREFDVDWENIAAAADWVAALPVEQEEQAKLVGDFALAVTDVVYWRKLPAEKWLLAGAAAFARLENKKREGLIYNGIAGIYMGRSDYDSAWQWLQKCVEIYETLENRAGLATSYNNIGMIYKARGDYDAALQWYQKSVAIDETLGDRAGLAASYNNIGEVNRARGDYDAALQWYQKSVAIKEALGDRAGLAISYSNIGLIYDARGDYDAALQWYQKGVEIQQELGNKASLAIFYNNIGEVSRARGDYDAALQWYQKSVAIKEALGDRAGLAASYNNIGGIYDARGDYDAALQWYQKSVAIQEALGDRAGLAVTLNNMGFVAQAKQDWSTALAYFTRSRDLYQQIGLEKKVQEKEALIEEVQAKIKG